MAARLDREGLGLVAVAILVVILLAAGGWFLYNPPGRADSTAEVQPPPVTSEAELSPSPRTGPREISYPGRDGATVLELLNESHRVRLDTELLLFGSIVLEIDSVAALPNEFWSFYRDSTRGDRSPERCTTRTGEVIRWVLTERR